MNKLTSKKEMWSNLKNESTPRNEDGTIRWRLPNGQLHREDGPAVEDSDGDKEWWLNGKEYSEEKIQCKN